MAVSGLEAALALVNKENTCVNRLLTEQHLTLNPRYIGNIPAGIREHLNCQLKLYSKSLKGVPIAYGKITCHQKNAAVFDDQPFLHLDCSTEVVVFQPVIGQCVTAVVNKTGPDYVGFLVHGVFNASMTKSYFKNQRQLGAWAGYSLKVGDEVVLRISKVNLSRGVVSIRGNIPREQDEENETLVTSQLDETDSAKQQKNLNNTKNKLKLKHSESNRNPSSQPPLDVIMASGDTGSVGSLDSGLGGGVTTPEDGPPKKHKKAKKAKRSKPEVEGESCGQSATQESATSRVEKDISSASADTSVVLSGLEGNKHLAGNERLGNDISSTQHTSMEVSSEKKKKKKKHKDETKSKENTVIGTKNVRVDDSGSGFKDPVSSQSVESKDVRNETIGSESLLSVSQNTTGEPSPSKKKKKKKNKEAEKDHDVIEIAVEKPVRTSGIENLNVARFDILVSLESSQQPTTGDGSQGATQSTQDSLQLSSVKKKKKKKEKGRERAELEANQTGGSDLSLVVETPAPPSVNDTQQSKTSLENSVELSTEESSQHKKKKSKRKREDSEVQVMQDSINNNDSALASHTKKKKKRGENV